MLLASCAGGPAGGGGDSGDGPIVIGGTLGLTGAYSGPSAGYKAAYDMWLNDINASGGLLGRQVEMKIYDDESNPTTAQQLYQRLINEDGVDLLLAPYTTAVGGAVVPLTERAGKVLFNGGFISRKLHSTSSMMVTSWPSQEEDVPRPFFDYLASLPAAERPTTIAVATLQNPFTLGERDGFNGQGGVLRMAEAAGMKVVLSEEYDAGATDLTGLVERVQQSGAQAFVGLTLAGDGALLAKAVNQVGYQPRYYCSCGSQVTTLPTWPDLGPAAENVFATTTAWPTQDNAGMAELSKHMIEELKVPALPSYAAVGYSILQVLQQSVTGANTLDQEQLRAYIGENTFDTAVGKLRYHPDGTVDPGGLLLQFQQGTNAVVWPSAEATGTARPFHP